MSLARVSRIPEEHVVPRVSDSLVLAIQNPECHQNEIGLGRGALLGWASSQSAALRSDRQRLRAE